MPQQCKFLLYLNKRLSLNVHSKSELFTNVILGLVVPPSVLKDNLDGDTSTVFEYVDPSALLYIRTLWCM